MSQPQAGSGPPLPLGTGNTMSGGNAVEIATQVAAGGGGAGGAGQQYQVDPEDIPEVIGHLEAALDKLEEAAKKAAHNAHVPTPGSDPYSPQAIQAMGPDLVRNYLQSNKAEQDQVRALIDNLKATQHQYQVNEDSAQQSLQERT